jgi:hypothetical protein
VLTVAAAIGAFALVIYLMSGLPKPREGNRIRTANNQFSIVAPPDWEPTIRYAAPDRTYQTTMDIQPKKSVGLTQKLFVGVYRNPPDLEKLKRLNYRNFTFQGQPALQWAGKNRNDYVWDMVFERGGAWYNLVLRLNLEHDVPNSDWWPYLETFQANPVTPASTSSPTPTTMSE